MALGNNPTLVIIPAAGTGTRMASAVPKQYLSLGEKAGSVLEVSVKTMQQALPEATVVVAVQTGDAVIASQDLSNAQALTRRFSREHARFCARCSSRSRIPR